MEIKETSSRPEWNKVLLEDSEFYKYIFKKTEKIVCAVFYVFRTNQDIRQNDVVVTDVESAATNLLNVSLEGLKGTLAHADIYAKNIQHALVTLEAKLRIAHASRYFREGYLEVFLHELDTVQRALRKYIEEGNRNPFGDVGTHATPDRPIRSRTERRTEVARSVALGASATPIISRRERIMNVIKDRGEATIKDIASVVTDCSEKTIQRELIELIKDSIVHRDGERRWSKYKLI